MALGYFSAEFVEAESPNNCSKSLLRQQAYRRLPLQLKKIKVIHPNRRLVNNIFRKPLLILNTSIHLAVA